MSTLLQAPLGVQTLTTVLISLILFSCVIVTLILVVLLCASSPNIDTSSTSQRSSTLRSSTKLASGKAAVKSRPHCTSSTQDFFLFIYRARAAVAQAVEPWYGELVGCPAHHIEDGHFLYYSKNNQRKVHHSDSSSLYRGSTICTCSRQTALGQDLIMQPATAHYPMPYIDWCTRGTCFLTQ